MRKNEHIEMNDLTIKRTREGGREKKRTWVFICISYQHCVHTRKFYAKNKETRRASMNSTLDVYVCTYSMYEPTRKKYALILMNIKRWSVMEWAQLEFFVCSCDDDAEADMPLFVRRMHRAHTLT